MSAIILGRAAVRLVEEKSGTSLSAFEFITSERAVCRAAAFRTETDARAKVQVGTDPEWGEGSVSGICVEMGEAKIPYEFA